MEFTLREGESFIKLGQLLKACGLAENGGHAKEIVLEGRVEVNGQVCLQRGKKISGGDSVTLGESSITVKQSKA